VGDRRVWTAAGLLAVPLLALLLVWLATPRPYYVGTDGVEDLTYVAQAPARVPVCVPGLMVPKQTAVIRLRVISATSARPELRMALRMGGRTIRSRIAPTLVSQSRVSDADFPIPRMPDRPAAAPASLCLTATTLVNWGGTPLPGPGVSPPTMGGAPMPARIAVWYLPRAGAEQSYLQRAGAIFERAALFRPGAVGAWTYPLLLFAVLPALALLALRTLALAADGRTRRLAFSVFAIAAVNACCWALITPVFQAPDEVDHFAYTQSLVERGQTPDVNPGSPRLRWSSSESLALEGIDFPTDHQLGDTRPPWLASEQREYEARAARLGPAAGDDGGYTTSAVHGPLYYLALSPAYVATRHASVFSQLTLMRIASALMGALVALFTFLLARELAPGRPWLAVLAALLVAYEPMYGFISGIVNNDVGVNAAAAALELLLIRLLRRGIDIRWGALTGVVLAALPNIKGTGLSLYPVAGLVFLAGLWRYHNRRDMRGWIALALAALVADELAIHLLGGLRPSAASGLAGPSAISSNASAVNEALHNIPGYLSYLWQALLPRLPFMAPHFPAGTNPGFAIFVERGWGAFGWYDVLFPHWVYVAILAAMLATVPLGAWAMRREWSWLRAHWVEALAVALMPVAVIAGFEAAYYTPGARPAIAEFGRYAFPAIGPLALLVVGALHAFGRRRLLWVGAGVLVAMIFLSYAAQLLTLTAFYA
jgi:Dolichyl-phosphate-mannose-protein mannosyltransferase